MNDRCPKKEISQDRPNSAKKPETIIPAPQRERIMQRHVLGQSIRQISREEKRARETVTKIVHGDDMRDFVISLRERFYGLGEHALDVVENVLIEGKDAQLGYRLLTDIGVAPSPLERERIVANQEVIKKEDLNEWEQALIGDQEGLKGQAIIHLGRVMQERAKFFDMKLPTPQELRHNGAVHELIDELTEGRGKDLCHWDPLQWNRLKALVEEHLRSLNAASEGNSLPQSVRNRLREGVMSDDLKQATENRQSHPAADRSENGGGKSRLNLS